MPVQYNNKLNKTLCCAVLCCAVPCHAVLLIVKCKLMERLICKAMRWQGKGKRKKTHRSIYAALLSVQKASFDYKNMHANTPSKLTTHTTKPFIYHTVRTG